MWRFLWWALRLSHAHKATHGYARQSCTGMLQGALGYGPTTPHRTFGLVSTTFIYIGRSSTTATRASMSLGGDPAMPTDCGKW